MQLSAAQQPERLHALDALRAIAMLLGIFVHIALCYCPFWSKFWILQDNYQHVIFDIMVLIIRACRMEIFFFMAGFFANLTINNKGDYYFIKNRILKILIPFIIFEPLMLIFIPLSAQQSIISNNLQQFRPFHLWFLYYLMLIYLSIYIFKFTNIHKTICIFYNKIICFKHHIFILIFITFLLLMTMKFIIIDTPSGFSVEYRLLIHYSLFFYFGWIVQHNRHILNIIINNKLYYLIIAIPNLLFVAISLVKFNHNYYNNFLYITVHFLIFKLCYACCIWCLSLSTIGFFQHYLNKKNKLLKYLSSASYWMYLTHLPVVFFLQHNLTNYITPGWLRPIVIFLAAVTILLVIYYAIKYLDKILSRTQNEPMLSVKQHE